MAKKYNLNSVSNTANVILNIFFIFFSLTCVLPFLLVVAISFSEYKSILAEGYRFIPSSVSLDAYRYLFKDYEVIVRAYGITIFAAFAGTFLDIIFLASYAYPLTRKELPFRGFFSWYILVTMLFSGGLASTYLVYVNIYHLRDTIWALILPHLGGGFVIFIMRTYFKNNVPYEIIESAKMDGAGEFRIFGQLVLPLSIPVLAAMSLGSVFGIWNDWQHSLYYINNPKLYSLQFVMQKALLSLQFIRQNFQNDPSIAASLEAQLPDETIRMAMVIVGIGPIIFAYPFFQKYFVKGLTVGSVKG